MRSDRGGRTTVPPGWENHHGPARDGRDRLRLRRAWRLAIVAIAVLTAAGCGSARQSYRPVYTFPAPASTPCTNCGTSSAVTTEGPDAARRARYRFCRTHRLPISRRPQPVLRPGPARARAAARQLSLCRSHGCLMSPPSTRPAPPSGQAVASRRRRRPSPLTQHRGPTLQGPAATQASPLGDRTAAGDGDKVGALYPKRVRRAA